MQQQILNLLACQLLQFQSCFKDCRVVKIYNSLLLNSLKSIPWFLFLLKSIFKQAILPFDYLEQLHNGINVVLLLLGFIYTFARTVYSLFYHMVLFLYLLWLLSLLTVWNGFTDIQWEVFVGQWLIFPGPYCRLWWFRLTLFIEKRWPFFF